MRRLARVPAPALGRAAGLTLGFCSAAGLSLRNSSIFGGACCKTDKQSLPRAVGARRTRSARPVPSAMATDGGLYEGAVVEVALSSNRRRVAIAQRPDGKRNWIVMDAGGTSASVAPRQITFHLGDTEEVGPDLAKIEAEAERAAKDSADLLAVAWEILAAADEPVQVSEVADVVFGSTESASLYAAHVLLLQDRTYFKARMIKGTTVYEPRSAALVKQATLVLEADKARAEEEARVSAQVEQSVAERNIGLAQAAIGGKRVEEITAALILLAEDPAAYGSPARGEAAFKALTKTEQENVRYILGIVRRPHVPSSAFSVLVAWGVFQPHENLFIRKLGLADDLDHGAESLQQAAELIEAAPADIDANFRRDLTHLPAFAVDSEDTTEIDDAVSWDPENGAIWVHVADATRFFPDETHPLVTEALRRAATAYLPTGKRPMFPEELASGLLSLGAPAGDGAALSFGLRVLDDGTIDESDIVVTCSRISQPRRLTYEQLGERLAAAETANDVFADGLVPLLAAAERRQKARIEDGARVTNNSFASVNVRDPESETPEIALGLVGTDSKAWLLVSELMIAACTAAGIFAEDHEVPLVFRGQADFESPPADALAAVPEGPARIAAMFRHATPSTTGLEPVNHASLGVDAYAQVTSPIRRAVDLIAHFQLKAHLRGAAPPFDGEALGKEIGRESDRGRRLRTAENRSNKYWQLEYLRRLPRGTEHQGTFVRMWKEEDRLGLVFFDEYAFDVFLRVPVGVKPGASLTVVFTDINPKAGQCRGSVSVNWNEDELVDKILELTTSDVDSEETFP